MGLCEPHGGAGSEGGQRPSLSPIRVMSEVTSIRTYALVTAAYWGFTVTDGALRMLVVLQFYRLGYSDITIAFLFLFYEFFGIVTNLFGGWIASRSGLRVTLYGGLAI